MNRASAGTSPEHPYLSRILPVVRARAMVGAAAVNGPTFAIARDARRRGALRA